ncbi:hypothetical protein GCM10009430_32210 [Aquimarina litoralis]|uniref:Uncharacterized protein n=1 Tax=Aquimarina litoralis TaxID=584605 RepID=A0ABN1J1Y9_9FLAO
MKKKLMLIAVAAMTILQSCNNDDLNDQVELQGEETEKELQEKANNSIPLPVIEPFNPESCTRELGCPGGATISVGNVDNQEDIHYILLNENDEFLPKFGDNIKDKRTWRGTTDFLNVPDGEYKIISVGNYEDLWDYEKGEDVPTSDPVYVTVDCGANPNHHPVIHGTIYASPNVGETEIVDVFERGVSDPDGDDLVIGDDFFGHYVPHYPKTVDVQLVENKLVIKRIAKGPYKIVYYTVRDGRGGITQGKIFVQGRGSTNGNNI